LRGVEGEGEIERKVVVTREEDRVLGDNCKARTKHAQPDVFDVNAINLNTTRVRLHLRSRGERKRARKKEKEKEKL